MTALHLVREDHNSSGASSSRSNTDAPRRSLLNSGATPTRELKPVATPDQLSVEDADVLFRALARWRPDDSGQSAVLAEERDRAEATQDFLNFFNIGDPATYDPTRRWGKSIGRDRLRIPLGRTPGGIYYHDFKQEPEGGHGPHGSMVAFTGGGKSDGLVSTVLATCIEHSPDEVQFILGDFKGAATFAPIETLPHVHGVVSNLEESADLLNRFVDSVMGELNYRQEILKAHDIQNALQWNIKRKRDFARDGGSVLEPMPALFTVIDEFGEATTLRPDLVDLFVSYNRLGRSLWCHALYASQHADSGRLEKIEANLGYRMAGKVTNVMRSREALGHGVPGSERAFTDLKNSPPGTFLVAIDGELEPPFRFWYTSSDYIPPSQRPNDTPDELVEQEIKPHRFTAEVAALPAVDAEHKNASDGESADSEQDDTHLDDDDVDRPMVSKVLSDQIARVRPKKFHRPLWRPPLKDTPELGIDELLAEHMGEQWEPSDTLHGNLVVPVARVDEAFRAAQYPQLLDLAGAGGNVGIVGAPQTGKSTSVLSLITALAMTHSPEQVQIYGIDLGGGLLPAISGLPHVGMVTTSDPNRMRRIMETVTRVYNTRSRAFEAATQGTDDSFTIRDYRARKLGIDKRPYPDDGFGDVFLVVDGLTALKQRHEALHGEIVQLVQSGLSYGIHLIYTNDKWSTVNHEINSKTDSRIELRLVDRSESRMTPHGALRPADYTVPDQPGRGLRTGGLHTLAPIPNPVGTQLSDHVATIRNQWASHKVAFVPRMLPDRVLYTELDHEPGKVTIGTGEQNPTVTLDFAASNHLIVVGDGQSGKSTALVSIAQAVREAFPDAGIFVADNHRDMAAVQGATGYFTEHPEIRTLFQQIAIGSKKQKAAIPSDAQSRARTAFQGKRTFLFIDDLHMLSGGSPTENPLAPLLEFIPGARDIGLHLIVAHTSASWTRYNTNPTMTALERGHSGVIILDGDRREGEIRFGHKPQRQLAPGRGLLAYRRSSEFIQIALPENLA